MKATPEEIVRQKTVTWLVKEIGVPLSLIRTEFNHRNHGGKGRSDILVPHPRDDGAAVLIVECKRPDTHLDEAVRAQTVRYANQVGARYCAFTDGADVTALAPTNRRGAWGELARLPRWKDMLAGTGSVWARDEGHGERWPHQAYGSRKQFEARLRDSGDVLQHIVGQDSPWYVGAFACNLYDLLVYESAGLGLPLSDDRLTVKRDLGLHARTFGNAAGGTWASSVYRSFLVCDRARSTHQVVSFLICASEKTVNDPVFGNRPGRTFLVVAVDDGPSSHLSLEACLDASISEAHVRRGRVSLFHNGALTAGRGGPVPRARVLEAVSADAPHLVVKGRVSLGTIPCDDLIMWPDARDLLLRTIRYALVRDELRARIRLERRGLVQA